MQKIILTLTLVSFHFISFCQDGYEQTRDYSYINITDLIPSDAEFQLMKHFDHPGCNGKVNVNLPLYTIKDRNAEIPIYLGYNTAGIKVSSVSPRVGTNWHLTAGGMITRVQQGALWDYADYSYGSTNGPVNNLGWQYNNENSSNYGTDIMDIEPDIFYLTAPDLSTEFIITKDEKAHEIKGDNIKIKDIQIAIIPEITNIVYHDIVSITILSDKGVEYTFNKYSLFSKYLSRTIQNWHLTKMVYPTGELISFEYDDSGVRSTILRNSNTIIRAKGTFNGNASIDIPVSSLTLTYYPQLTSTTRLRKIIFGSGSVEFNYNHERQDIIGDYALSEILIKNKKMEIIEYINLNYNYLYNSSGSASRLMLKQLFFKGKNAQIVDEYSLDYNVGVFPSYTSFQYDYYGYYSNNGQTNNTTQVFAYIPSDVHQTEILPFLVSGYSSDVVTFSGDDRSSNELESKIGMLTKIHYPTGGYLELEYESNVFNVLGSNQKGAGLRIKKQSLKDENCNWVKEYEYYFPVVKLPRFGRFDNDPNVITNPSSSVEKKAFVEDYTVRYKDNPVNIDLLDGSPILYTKVIEKQFNNGSIEYFFNVIKDEPANIELKRAMYCQYPINSFLTYNPKSEWPFYKGRTNAPMRGQIIQKWVFDKNRNAIQAELYDYSFRKYPNKDIVYGYEHQQFNRAALYNTYPIYPGKAVLNYKYTLTIPNGCILPTPGDPIIFDWLQDDQNAIWNNLLIKRERFIYNYENQISYNLVKQSSGIEKGSLYIYASDFNLNEINNGDDMILGIIEMNKKNLISTPLELLTTIHSENLNYLKITSGKLVEYTRIWSSDINDYIIYPVRESNLNLINPISYLSYKFSTIIYDSNKGKYTLSSDPNYDFYKGFNYSNHGNLLSANYMDDYKTSYLWGYNYTYPIADVVNAENNEIAYTGFEYPEDGSVKYVTNNKHFGKYSYKLNSNDWIDFVFLKVPKSQAAGIYNASVWIYTPDYNGTENIANFGYYIKDKNNNILKQLSYYISKSYNGWKKIDYSFTIDDALIAQNTTNEFILNPIMYTRQKCDVYIDDFRFHPSDAQMSTYTYEPLVGITSVTGPDNRTTTYEYDDFGRLKCIKDHEGNIIEYYDYHYKE